MSDDYLKDPRAGTFEGWVVALSILSKYNPKGIAGYLDTSSEHDVLYVGGGPRPVSVDEDEDGEATETWGNPEAEADAKLLNGLGFHYEDDVESWAKFT